jgi:hypothetical protein
MLKPLPVSLIAVACLCMTACTKNAAPQTGATTMPAAAANYDWQPLFDGKTLGQWKQSEFAGGGEVTVKDGTIVIAQGGGDLSGITWSGKYPKVNYEIYLEAKRISGSDFFCGLTFPLNNTCASLICGGWGGSLVGISSLDGYDAANNETTRTNSFKSGEWYQIRMRVTNEKFMAWIDDKQFVHVSHKDKKVDIRIEVFESKPLGVATFNTSSALRDIRIRELTPQEVAETNAKDPGLDF